MRTCVWCVYTCTPTVGVCERVNVCVSVCECVYLHPPRTDTSDSDRVGISGATASSHFTEVAGE